MAFIQRFNGVLFLIFIGLIACSNPTPPSTPSSVDSPANADGHPRKKKGSKVADEEETSGLGEVASTSEKGAKDDEDAPKSTESNAKKASDSVPTGADVGDDATKEAVKKCAADHHFYDRFTAGEEPCTKLSLAKVNCSADSLRKILSDKQKTQWDEAVSGAYQDWSVDQCVDCAPDDASGFCKNSDGKVQVGTKVYFVKEDAGKELRGKSMLLPLRPGH